MGSRWEPILPDYVTLIARDITTRVSNDLSSSGAGVRSPLHACELALLFAYLAKAESSEVHRDNATRYLDMASILASGIENWDSCPIALSWIGWTFEHLRRALWNDDDESMNGIADDDPVGDVDVKLINELQKGPWRRAYNLVDGLVGIGVYFLERLPRSTAVRGVCLVLDHLEEQSENSWGGITWFTPPELMPHELHGIHLKGHYDLGIAHGVSGVLAFLGNLVALRIEVLRAQRLLEGAVQWLLAQERRASTPTRFGCQLVPGQEQADSPLAWAYGDLGIGTVLYRTASQILREDWRTIGMDLLQGCITRVDTNVRIQDTSLWYGLVGVAHTYARLYHIQQESIYKEAAIKYYDRGLHLLKRSCILDCGMWRSSESTVLSQRPSLLSGIVGVVLALISATYPVEPEWDRALLMSGWPQV